MDEQQDPRVVRLIPGAWKKKPGVLIETKDGRVFIPAYCLPEVRRQLGGIQHRWETAQ